MKEVTASDASSSMRAETGVASQAPAPIDTMKDRAPDDTSATSIIITCYNHGRYLGEAIESAIKQTWPPLEIIVVDDGSIDNTSEVVKQYPNVIGIRQENQGVCAARNTGLRACHGKYVLFLDADDLLLPGALEASVGAMNAHPDWAFVSGDFRNCDEKGNILGTFGFTEVTGDHYLALLRRNYVAMHATVLYRRSVFDQVGGFDTRLRTAEDHEVFLRIARQFPVGQAHGLMALYRHHTTNTSRDAKQMLLGAIEVIGRERAYFGTDPHRWAAYRAGMQHNCANYCQRFLLESLGRLKHAKSRKDGIRGILFLLRHPTWLWYTYWNKRALRRIAKALAPFLGRWLLRFAS